MRVARSAVDNALFSVLENAYAWNYKSMRLKHWSNVDQQSDQPAMFLRRTAEPVEQTKGYGNNKYTLKYEAWIYFAIDPNDTTFNPYTVIDPIIDAVDAALAAQAGPQALGGLVDNVRISGTIGIDDGSQDGQGVIFIPVIAVTN